MTRLGGGFAMQVLVGDLADIALGMANLYTPIIILAFIGIGVLAYNVRRWSSVYNPTRAGLALRALALGFAACLILFGFQRIIRRNFIEVSLEIETPTGSERLFSATYTMYDAASMFLEIVVAAIAGRRVEVYDPSSILLKSVVEDLAMTFTIAMLIILSLLLLLSTVVGLAALFNARSSVIAYVARLLPILFLVYIVLAPLTLPATGFTDAKRSLLRYGFTRYLSLRPSLEDLIARHGERVLDLGLSFNAGTIVLTFLVAVLATLLVFLGTRKLKAEPYPLSETL